jgi:hypothetical protein
MTEEKKGREHKASRQHKDSSKYTALNKAPFRYAIIEMGDYDDARVFENCLSRCCRKVENVSPAIGRGITFKKEKAGKWPEYRDAIENFEYSGSSTDEPDWWYISGHHGIWGDGKYYALKNDAGFFNDIYYKAQKKKKIKGEVRNALFMLTSRKDYTGVHVPRTLLSDQVNPNPLYNKSPNSSSKGLFLIGCNTLISSNVISQLKTQFPKAVIFGYFGKAPGYAKQQNNNIKAIFKSVRGRTPSFFEDPGAYFQEHGQEDSLKEIVGKIANITRKRVLVISYKGKVYVPEYFWGLENLVWNHKYPHEKHYNVKMVICPVPGKNNPFKYEQDRKFITGLKMGSDAEIYPNFSYSEFSKIMDPVRLNTLLLYILQNIRTQIEASISPKDVRKGGNEIEVFCRKIDKFNEKAEYYKKQGYVNKVRKLRRNGRTHFSLTVS